MPTLILAPLLAFATPMAAVAVSSPDLLPQRPSSEAELHKGPAVDPASAEFPGERLVRLKRLRAQVAALRHRQGGTLSADQQTRFEARLAALASGS